MTESHTISPIQIGPYTVTVLPVGRFALDGGAMFGVVPKTLWQKTIVADEKNRIPLAQNCLLIEYEGQRLLLDTGIGLKFNEKFQQIYDVETNGGIVEALSRVGLKPEDIDQVMLTHMHFDHAGGLTHYDTEGKLKPTFEKARHLIHKGEWTHANHPNQRDKASYLTENIDPVRDVTNLQFLEGPDNEILPGLKLMVTGGHTQDHQVLILDRPEGGFIYWADIIPTHHHLKIPFVMGYDLYPVDTMAVKERLLKESFEKQWVNLFEHDVDVPAAKLTLDEQRGHYVLNSPISVA